MERDGLPVLLVGHQEVDARVFGWNPHVPSAERSLDVLADQVLSRMDRE